MDHPFNIWDLGIKRFKLFLDLKISHVYARLAVSGARIVYFPMRKRREDSASGGLW